MQTDPLITWSEPATELIGFVALFLVNGAIGFRYAALRGRLATAEAGDLFEPAARRAAALGLMGALVQAVLLVTRLPRGLSSGAMRRLDGSSVRHWWSWARRCSC
jgi:hypothetical protein